MEMVAEMSIADMETDTPYEIVYGNDKACLEELRRLKALKKSNFRFVIKAKARNVCNQFTFFLKVLTII